MTRARHAFWPELLWELLGPLHGATGLLPRALDLLASEDEFEQGLGRDLLYALPSTRAEVLSAIDRRLAAATGAARRRLLAARRQRAGSWLARIMR